MQNNPDRYVYQILVFNVDTVDRLNALEIQYIKQLKPKFNFTDGGEGTSGWRHSEEAKQKMRGPRPSIQGERHPFFNKHHTEETKEKISNINKKLWDNPDSVFNSKEYREKLSQNNARYWSGRTIPAESRKKISKTLSDKYNKTGFYRVSKEYNSRFKKGYRWCYQYRDTNNRRRTVSSTSLQKLEHKVKDKKLLWKIIDSEKAQRSLEEDNIGG